MPISTPHSPTKAAGLPRSADRRGMGGRGRRKDLASDHSGRTGDYPNGEALQLAREAMQEHSASVTLRPQALMGLSTLVNVLKRAAKRCSGRYERSMQALRSDRTQTILCAG